jgi:hypothetical protein
MGKEYSLCVGNPEGKRLRGRPKQEGRVILR